MAEEETSSIGRSANTLEEVPVTPAAITMEVPLLLATLAMTLSGAALSNIILYRTCVHTLNYSEEECQVFLSPYRTNTTDNLEEEVQKYATFVSTTRMVIESVAPAVCALFIGVWSDTYGRKPLVVWPLFGMTLSAIMMVVYAKMNQLGPWWFLLTAVPSSLSGGLVCLFTGAFCYLSDITSTETRSFRLTVLEGAISVGYFLGSILSTYLLKVIGNVFLLLISATLFVIAWCFTKICLKESLRGALKGGITTIIDFLLVKEMIRECFKRRPNYERAQIMLLVVANCLIIFTMYGVANLDYMYFREKLHWSLIDYMNFTAASIVISFTGSIVGVLFFTKLLRFSDMTIVMIAYISMIVDSIVKAVVASTWQMYLVSSATLFRSLSGPLIRSHLTKILPLQDIAKVFALIAAIEGICPLISPPLYNAIYVSSISTFPGAIYLLTGGVIGLGGVLIGFAIYFRWKTRVPYEPVPVNNPSVVSF